MKEKTKSSLVPALMSDRLALWNFTALGNCRRDRARGGWGGRCKINENTTAFMCVHTRLTCAPADEAKTIPGGRRAESERVANASQTHGGTVIYPTPSPSPEKIKELRLEKPLHAQNWGVGGGVIRGKTQDVISKRGFQGNIFC